VDWLRPIRAFLSSDERERIEGVDRRSFLRLVGAGSVGVLAASTFDVERLLWTPRQLVTVRRPTIVTADWIVRDALRILENNLTLTKIINRS